jgi:hypothetical protein
MFTLEFWKATFERAVKTAAQAAILAIIATGFTGVEQVNAFTVDWVTVAGFALGGFILSGLFSLASGFVGNKGTPSLTRVEVLSPPATVVGAHEERAA